MARAKKANAKDEEKEEQNSPDPIESDEEVEEESSGSNDDQDSDDEDNVNISSEEIKHAIALATAAANKKFGWGKESKLNGSGPSNPLSDIIPGYIAPMTLDSSSLDKFKNPKRLISSSSASKSVTMEIPNKPSFSSKNFKVGKRDPIDIAKNNTNAGSGWFNFEAAPNTSAMQADIAIIRNRNYIDPKKFYKASDFNKRGSHMVQMGTVIEGAMESVFSNRLTKKQRKENVLEEIMGETFGSKDDYVKRKFAERQREKSEVGRTSSKKSKGKGRFRGDR
uniref:Fcf2 pre-rRNA processing C-terminal domain-containing protein n=1 Tax=Chaetoceros debilis TaxID=122233 RepID=A0A7S3PY45_9STRA|mmetsp:Transcript_26376/g.40320  ORF Transcript_26376/g.40320 Transcript_26376/m.40320 type:complete len:280 (-) Transcript_26376:236-1075(-)